jgi:filamentous hemagglutinin family protein
MTIVKTKPPVAFVRSFRRAPSQARAVLVAMLSTGVAGAGLQAQGPVDGVVRAGEAWINQEGATTRIDQVSERAIIDWRSFGIGAADQVIFLQPSAQSATLNRVTGDQVSVILGRLDANGQVLLVNPNGVVFGGGAQINVGSLIASTSNISNANFMAGRLVFDEPGRAGAGIFNGGALTARDGGLVALVAPHVRNDGVIVARLGKVVLGSADTFTIDLYGDALINLALSDAHAGQLRDANGEPIGALLANGGTIDTAGGRTVLMTARSARNVLDSLINMSGTIKADTAVQQGGRILLLGEGGTVRVDGSLSAQGATGGGIEVLGDQVRLGASASLDASGAAGGGTVHVGGAFQGGGDTYRARQTTVDAGAMLKANAIGAGNGGEVVVWADGRTEFAGTVEARGGAAGGNGGRMEVSGKDTLEFLGHADASAAAGQAGSLLLDPTNLDIGADESSVITRVLRTGTSASLQADNDINVNSAIYGGDRNAGGGLTMTAGNNINVNDFIVTNDGAINLNAAQGTVNVLPGKALFAGTAPITINASGSISTAPLVTSGSLSIHSIAGSVRVASFIDGRTGPVSIRAAGNVDIDEPIVNMSSVGGLSVTAGRDINVNAQVDGREGPAGGSVAMTASGNLNVNDSIVTNNGAVSLTASSGTLRVAPDAVLLTGSAPIALSARGDVTSGQTSAGALSIASGTGAVAVNGLIDSATGETRINAATDVHINQPILNGQTGSALIVNAGNDINVNAQVNGRGGAAGGAVTLAAGRNLNVNQSLLTNNGAMSLTATTGAATVAPGQGLFAGSAPIAVRSGADLTTGIVSGGSLSATSTGGSVRLNGLIDGTTGRVDVNAARDVLINQPVLNGHTGGAFNATAGGAVTVNAQIDGRGGAAGGAVNLKAGSDVTVNSSVVTNNGAIGITATGGSATMAAGATLATGNAAVRIDAGRDVTTSAVLAGSLSAYAGRSVNINGVIDGNTGRVDLGAGGDVNINQAVLNPRSGASFSASAGQNINVNAQIDGSGGAAGGTVTLAAARDLTVNAAIATRDAAINLSATNGVATIAPAAGLFAGAGAISLDALGNVTTSVLSGGAMNVTSRGGSVTLNGVVNGSGGAVAISAAGQVDVANTISIPGASPLTITAGTSINVNAPIDGRSASNPALASGAVVLNAGQDVNLNDSIVTKDASISVTAQNGSVVTADDEGLYAGSGSITVQSGQTLTTKELQTSGNLTLRSTSGSVNLDTAIAAETGAVTISAGQAVNVNRSIANQRSDAPLTITAGTDITINATIDGRDDPLTAGSSGTITMTAGNDIALNEDVATKNAAIALTATSGTVVTGAGQGLYAGNAAIAVTSGETLDTGILSTTGALNLTSTAGGVNINNPIADTTGAVTIDAATTVNINEAITNLKSGSNLAITAGTDINVLAQVDGRSGAAGGTVTMTAGNDLNVSESIATNNGAVTLTATNGSVTVPTGVESFMDPMDWIVSAGNAPISITSGSDFTLASPVVTTGALTIASTDGDVTIAAPITDQTGAVTITAGDALTVNHQVKSNNQAITLNAGAGGITVNAITDYDSTLTSPINSGTANLTLNSVGNVSIHDSRGIASAGTLTIDTRGQIVTGSIGHTTPGGTGLPQALVLIADQGIASFSTGSAGTIDATSSGGTINLTVGSSSRLRITTGTPGTSDCPTCDINLTSSHYMGYLGPDTILNAGGSVNLPPVVSGGTLVVIARSGDANLQMVLLSDELDVTAGRDVSLTDLVWIGNSPQDTDVYGGPLTLTAGRDILTTASSPIHVSNGQELTLTAGRNVILNLIETLGPVTISATSGDITLNNDIGPHILNSTSDPDFNPDDKGVESLTVTATTGDITMQGARAEGDVSITAGGDLTAAKAITSVNGTVTITTGGTQTLSATPIGSQTQLTYPGFVSPVAPPGPKQVLPTAPGVASNGAGSLPVLGEIPVSTADQIVGGLVQAPGIGGAAGLPGTPGGAGGPLGFSAAATRPGIAQGGSAARATGSSDPGTADTAAALRVAGQACGEGTVGDTGLNAVSPGESKAAADPKAASCPPVESGDQASAADPADPAGRTPAAPPAASQGSSLQ